MPTKRTHYSGEFKFKIGILALSNTMTIGEIASQYEVHSTQVSQWKKLIQEKGGTLFEGNSQKKTNKDDQQKKLDRLYSQIGQLTVENDWLKKKSGILPLGH